jgi:hypothetical protein
MLRRGAAGPANPRISPSSLKSATTQVPPTESIMTYLILRCSALEDLELARLAVSKWIDKKKS